MAHFALTFIFIVNIIFNGIFAENLEKIVGGTNASPGQFPYQVSLRKSGRHFCGGTLITERHVVTAAHCIHGIVSAPYNDFIIVTGTISNINGGQSYRVAKTTINPDFKPSSSESYRNDIAIVTLTNIVKSNTYQKPISPASSDPPVGATLIMSGWGRTSTNGNLPEILQTTNVYLMSNEECQKRIPNYHIYNGQLCTFKKKGVGICMGDSGGPLVYNGQLIGIASWVIPCAQGYPDAYTRVTQYRSFINQVVFNI
ncbi:chymotrypsin-1-like [Apis laboriosa]|uniref:chymotrypsin-1-like n=1 Tax=Apis laboriosa TaxID=183418 RepID=UPI001CC44794|nr:chymotrypsin-1-like [Apis laboriosa]